MSVNNSFLKELKVLLVEDEQKLSLLLKEALGDNFASFDIASNGEEGVEMFKAISPDLIITDIMMPKMTGLEMVKELKRINPEISVIILSAFSDSKILLEAIDVGILKYFVKPFDPEELLEYIVSISTTLVNNIISLAQDFRFNTNTNTLYLNNKLISLTRQENQFISLLIKKSHAVCTDRELKKTLWAGEDEISDERLRTFIKRFRVKTDKKLIKNIKGQGYQIAFV